jgi:hypothetical protein
MKKILLIISLLISSTATSLTAAHAEQCAVMGPNGCVLTEAQAQASNNGGAGQCNASNPCGTWAVLDNSNTVTNVIVCQTAVCGSGTFANKPVVLQVPASESGQPQGSVFVENPTPEQVVKYDPSTNTFTQGTVSFAAPVVRTEKVDSATLTATINSELRTFSPNSFVDGQMKFTPVVTSNTSATISVIEGLTREMAMFETPKTREQLQTAIVNKLLVIQKYLHRYYVLLGGWLID